MFILCKIPFHIEL